MAQEPVEELLDGALACGQGVGGSSARAIIKASSLMGGQHDVGEGVDMAGRDTAGLGGFGQQAPDHSQGALFVQFPPALPAQDRRQRR